MVLVGAVVESEKFTQIPLDIRLDTSRVFANFYTNQQNQNVVDELQVALESKEIVIIKGATASGKTHLLQAICNHLVDDNFMYVPVKKFKSLSPQVLNVETNLNCICIDDVDLLLGDHAWEKAIFDIYNQAFDKKFSLLMSLSSNNLKFNLPDLQSRFAKTKKINLPMLDDVGKKEAFLLQAMARGIKMDSKVLAFISNHYSRNLKDMLDLLDRLDQTSLQNKHKITVPMVKKVMDNRPTK